MFRINNVSNSLSRHLSTDTNTEVMETRYKKNNLKGLKVNGKTRKPRFLKNHPLAVTLPSQSQFGHSKLTRKSHDKLTTWSRHHFPNPRIVIVGKCTGYASKLRGRGHPVNSWKHLLSVCLSGGHDQVM